MPRGTLLKKKKFKTNISVVTFNWSRINDNIDNTLQEKPAPEIRMCVFAYILTWFWLVGWLVGWLVPFYGIFIGYIMSNNVYIYIYVYIYIIREREREWVKERNWKKESGRESMSMYIFAYIRVVYIYIYIYILIMMDKLVCWLVVISWYINFCALYKAKTLYIYIYEDPRGDLYFLNLFVLFLHTCYIYMNVSSFLLSSENMCGTKPF